METTRTEVESGCWFHQCIYRLNCSVQRLLNNTHSAGVFNWSRVPERLRKYKLQVFLQVLVQSKTSVLGVCCFWCVLRHDTFSRRCQRKFRWLMVPQELQTTFSIVLGAICVRGDFNTENHTTIIVYNSGCYVYERRLQYIESHHYHSL